MGIESNMLESAIRQFMYYKHLGERAMRQLEPAQLFISPNEDSNSIAIIVKHLCGNMRSRWTNLLTSDGEKPWRMRDEEFEWETADAAQVWHYWEQGWRCLLDALEQLPSEQLMTIIYIRNEGHTVLEAIQRQLGHYPYHVGQIVYAAKMLKSTTWDSLSIPRQHSAQYNSNKFQQPQQRRHFTEDV
ncbi:DUF1572 family protein [Paenibacillus campi]|uniref:DUF1572 family protein n=1 Tax=Paenibacillus campi TaxID=3106031 RepID=UPI002AFDFC60|nr:DUF1572 family protein [Paenibacillus sp. SGZ-1014]